MTRPYRQPLTVGDGFRIGFGIAFWMLAASVLRWVFAIGFGLALGAFAG